eukprot:SM000182S03948  [mRNA]  locus=s182:197645:201238:- [translate_table: standard]
MLVAWHFVPDIPLYFDYRYPQPNATATFLPNDVLATALPRAAKARAGKVFNGPHVVPKGQRFRVILNLQLPESSHNRNLGIFQIEAQLLALQGDVLASKSVPTMLRFRSWPVEYGRTFLMALPLLSGFWDDFQTLSLPILEHQEGRRPFVSVRIELAPKAGLSPAVGLPEIYEAEVFVESVLTGFARIFRYWKLTSLVWGLIAFISLELTLLLTCCSRALFPKLWGLRPQVEEKVPIAKVVETAQAAVDEYKEAELPPTPDLSDVDEFEDDLMKSLPFELAVLRSRKGRKKSLTVRDQSREGTLDEDMDDSEAQYEEEEAGGEEVEDGEGLWQDPLASILSDEVSEDGEEFGVLGRHPLGLHGDKPRAQDGHETLGLPMESESKEELKEDEESSTVDEAIDGGSNVQRSGLPLGDMGKPVIRQLGSEAVTNRKGTGSALGGFEGARGPAHTEGEASYAYHMPNEPGDSGIGYEEMEGHMGKHAGDIRGKSPISPDAAQSSGANRGDNLEPASGPMFQDAHEEFPGLSAGIGRQEDQHPGKEIDDGAAHFDEAEQELVVAVEEEEEDEEEDEYEEEEEEEQEVEVDKDKEGGAEAEDIDGVEKHLEDALEERGRSNSGSASNDLRLEGDHKHQHQAR